MPLPKPNAGEQQRDFVARCMGAGIMTKDFPKAAQRRAVCQKQWDTRNRAMAKSRKASQDLNAARLFLDPPGDRSFAPTDGVHDEHGVQTGSFVKDIIRAGTYTHPVHGWTMDVTPERMDRWIAAFGRMRENGVDVEVVKDHSLLAEAVLGYVTNIFRDGDVLFGVHEMRGENAIGLAKRVKNVSVLVERDYKDGKGTAYGEAITHSAVVQKPVVPGQEPFVQIAASTGGMPESVPRFGFGSAWENETMTKEMLDELREILGAGDDLKEDNALSLVKARLDAITGEKDKFSTQVTNLQAKLAAAEKKQPAKAASLPADLVEQMATTGTQQLDLLVQTGKITPAVRDKLAASLVGAAANRNVMAMSVGEGGGKPSVLSTVIDALKDNDVVKLGEQINVMAMSRETPGKEESSFDPEVNKEMINMAGGPAKD